MPSNLPMSAEMPHETEDKLLTLLEMHLKSTEKALSDLRGGMDHLAERIDMTSDRVFKLAVAILIVLAASSGANLYISWAGLTVGTGTAAGATP